MRRVLSIICPWYVLWRLRQLSAAPFHPEADEWFRGYERAMWEIRLTLGTEDAP